MPYKLSHKIVAIHQPNYLPWIGYFHKIARADAFVFLDDVQFSKGSYTNRVQILSPFGAKWITIPVTVSLGQAICDINFANSAWRISHVNALSNAYSNAQAFTAIWPEIKEAILCVKGDDLATVNISLITFMPERLGLCCTFYRSSEFQLQSSKDNRLIEIITQIAPDATYFSGRGASKYQDPNKFLRAGIGFFYSEYHPPIYKQSVYAGSPSFISGLSVLDAVFNLGWSGAAELVAKSEC